MLDAGNTPLRENKSRNGNSVAIEARITRLSEYPGRFYVTRVSMLANFVQLLFSLNEFDPFLQA